MSGSAWFPATCGRRWTRGTIRSTLSSGRGETERKLANVDNRMERTSSRATLSWMHERIVGKKVVRTGRENMYLGSCARKIRDGSET